MVSIVRGAMHAVREQQEQEPHEVIRAATAATAPPAPAVQPLVSAAESEVSAAAAVPLPMAWPHMRANAPGLANNDHPVQ
jgi:hypothetical protein